jgi:hypothetical protein
LLLAVVSGGAEYAAWKGGVGLSGVVYGLCTLLWVVQGTHPALHGTITRRTLEIFGVWLIVCFVLTVTNILPVGNIAHGAGAVCGWLLGKCIVAAPRRRAAWCGALAAITLLVCVGATVGRPWVNFTQWLGDDSSRGYAALRQGRYDDAIRLLEAAAQKQPHSTSVLTNLGSAYAQKDRPRQARELWLQVVAIDPAAKDRLASSIASTFDQEAAAAAKHADLAAVRSFAQESLRWNPNGAYPKKILEWARATEAEKSKGSGGGGG